MTPEYIDKKHPISPKLPPGRAKPRKGEAFDGASEWPNFDQSRPFICHVPDYNFTMLNVFHYGFREEDAYIRGSQHFYPPGKLEDRITWIVEPLLASVRHAGVTPDMFTMTPGFWGLMRMAIEDDERRNDMLAQGRSAEEPEVLACEAWNEMRRDRMDYIENRIVESLRFIAEKWPKRPGDVFAKPRILWSASFATLNLRLYSADVGEQAGCITRESTAWCRTTASRRSTSSRAASCRD